MSNVSRVSAISLARSARLPSGPVSLRHPIIKPRVFLLPNLEGAMESLLSVEPVVAWRWRCECDAPIVSGADLCVTELPTTTLAAWRSPKIYRRKLRCPCGSFVVPVTSLDIEQAATKTYTRRARSLDVLAPTSRLPARNAVAARSRVETTPREEALQPRRRRLLMIALASIIWLASAWLAATLAQAQELPLNHSNLKMVKPVIGQRYIEKTGVEHVLLSNAGPADFESPDFLRARRTQSARALPTNVPGQNLKSFSIGNEDVRLNSITPSNLYASLTNDPIANARGGSLTQAVGNVDLPFNLRGPNFCSLAALSSTLPASWLYRRQSKYVSDSSEPADSRSLTGDNGLLVYQIGKIKLVVNQLPNSFSVSSSGAAR